MFLMPRRRLLGAAMAALVPALPALAGGRRLTCGVMEAPPWHLPDDPKQGVAVEVMGDLSRHSGLDIQIVPAPLIRLIMGMKAGQLDLITFFELPELQGLAEPVGILGHLAMGVVTRPGLNPQSPADLAGCRIGLLRGNNRDNLTKTLPSSVILVELRDLTLGLTMIIGGRLDALIGTPLALGWHLKQGGFAPGSVGPFFKLLSEPLYLYLSTVRHYDDDTPERLRVGMRSMDRNLARLTSYYWKGAGYDNPPPLVDLSPRKPPPP